MLVKVKFTKINNKIKYEIPFKIYCNDMKVELPNSGIFPKTDGIFKNIDLNFKKSNVIIKKVDLSYLGYDSCDGRKRY